MLLYMHIDRVPSTLQLEAISLSKSPLAIPLLLLLQVKRSLLPSHMGRGSCLMKIILMCAWARLAGWVLGPGQTFLCRWTEGEAEKHPNEG